MGGWVDVFESVVGFFIRLGLLVVCKIVNIDTNFYLLTTTGT